MPASGAGDKKKNEKQYKDTDTDKTTNIATRKDMSKDVSKDESKDTNKDTNKHTNKDTKITVPAIKPTSTFVYPYARRRILLDRVDSFPEAIRVADELVEAYFWSERQLAM
jgi:hypothetical protein